MRTGMRLRRHLAKGVVVAAMLGATPTEASAVEINFCGRNVDSGTSCTGPLANGFGTWWNYTRATFPNGASINKLWACMVGETGARFTFCYVGYNTNYAAGCWTKNYPGSDYGEVFQNDDGRRHTIYGVNNDGNHGGCSPAYRV